MQTQREVSIVMIVGSAMNQTVGVTSRACGALSRSGINPEFIIQGASEISVMFMSNLHSCNYAVKARTSQFYPFGPAPTIVHRQLAVIQHPHLSGNSPRWGFSGCGNIPVRQLQSRCASRE